MSDLVDDELVLSKYNRRYLLIVLVLVIWLNIGIFYLFTYCNRLRNILHFCLFFVPLDLVQNTLFVVYWIWFLVVKTYLGINADDLIALLATISENALVTLDAVGVFIPEHVALAGKRLVALPAAEVTAVPVLVHGLGVFTAENKLWTKNEVMLTYLTFLQITILGIRYFFLIFIRTNYIVYQYSYDAFVSIIAME